MRNVSLKVLEKSLKFLFKKGEGTLSTVCGCFFFPLEALLVI